MKKNEKVTLCQAAVPYDGLPPLALAPASVASAASQATRHALGYLQGALAQLPNPALLLSTIPTLEAADSSHIENIVTTGERLFRLSATPEAPTDRATREAAACHTALRGAVASLADVPLSWRTARGICSQLVGQPQEVRRSRVTLSSQADGKVVYTPPTQPGVLAALISEWERQMHAETADPLAHIARLHYQFVAIHPFMDGNGRTARILHLLLLQQYSLLDHPVLYLSRSIRRSKAEYYARLSAVTYQGDWAGLERYFSDVTQDAVAWTLLRVRSVLALRARTEQQLRTSGRRLAREGLLDALFEQPYCRIAAVAQRLSITKQTATRLLDALCNLGILRPDRQGRDKLYFFPALMDALQGPPEG